MWSVLLQCCNPFFQLFAGLQVYRREKNDTKIMLAHVTLYNMIVQDKTEGATIHIGMNDNLCFADVLLIKVVIVLLFVLFWSSTFNVRYENSYHN